MKLKTLCCISLSSMFLFSACGQNSNETSHNNNQKTEKKSNTNETSNNQNSNKNKSDNSNETQSSNEQVEHSDKTITVAEAKSIVYNSANSQSFKAFVQNKDELIFNKDKSNNNEIFIETPFGGINESVKLYAIVNRHTGEIITTGSAGTHADGLIKTDDGKIDKKAYNITLEFYNTYVYKKGMPKFEEATSDMPAEEYKKLSQLVGDYTKKQKQNENKEPQTNNNTQNEANSIQSNDRDKTQSTTNERTNQQHNTNEKQKNDQASKQEQQSEEQQENRNEESSQNEEREDPNQQIEQPSSEDKQTPDATQENNNQNNDENTDDKNYENEQTQDVESKGSGNDKETSNAS
ncbi:hypothetical protein [Staphylococcus epidermidis]|uniref:hypothetical protein n=1 Tax=Staphylococcus epidermidis TaxID=1282 RepID=UPI00030DB021|nr:hypothetical protein [Staphylococcus epidermidis]MBF2224510.1 hypothetical protein [Staphylococcus epidermidis]MCG1102672.1 hypothetical protein [Staphylococcus epidermidis]MCG2202662.1 hypothetical protein [Staphylococcus epidermidis]MCG2222275.1 hypothetical protein [Staphylococcus epidermidis]MCG2395716.1 hypothetical protein [Staphylococcus epidermidis]